MKTIIDKSKLIAKFILLHRKFGAYAPSENEKGHNRINLLKPIHP